jgi:hypothetical protein
VSFNFLALVLHDAKSNTMRLHVLETDETITEPVELILPVEGDPAGQVWHNQKPLLAANASELTSWPEFAKRVQPYGVQSCCWMPLTTAQRRLGTLVFASKQSSAYVATEVDFLEIVANHVAIAVDNARAYEEARRANALKDAFERQGYLYTLLFVALIYVFCYFWTAISFNPKDMAENLKNFGTFIPGYRPGKRTADYLEKVMLRITYVGAGFLALVAITPTIIAASMYIPYNVAAFYGGTGLLIAVSVAFDVVQKIDSHLVMRNYRGLLEK